MEIVFQLIDCDYVQINNSPVVRLFGKTKEGKTVCAFYKNHYPYFYILPKEGAEDKIIEFLNKKFIHLVTKVEETEKFLPIGFKKNKTKLLKVTLKNPSEVPSIREELKAEKIAKEIFEADILFKYRFMSDFKISGMKWYKVSGECKNTTTVKADRMIEIKNIEEVEDSSNVQFKFLSVDIEIVSNKETLPDPKTDKIAIISLAFSPSFNDKDTLVLISKSTKTNKDVICFRNEKEMLEEFIRIVNSFDPDVITGYNINNFDLPYITERLRECNVFPSFGRCNQKPVISMKIGTKSRNTITGRVFVDVYKIVKEAVEKGQVKIFKLKRYGLGDVAKEILGETKVDISHSEIPKYWNGNEEQVNKLIEYAKKDAVLALRILLEKNLLDKFIEISRITGILLQDVLDGGETARIENLLLREFNKQDFVLPLKPDSNDVLKRMEEREAKSLKGALVLEPDAGLHTNVIYLDFKSLYPHIFIAYNICPTTLLTEKMDIEKIMTPNKIEFVAKNIREGLIPKIVRYLVNERDRLKKLMKTANEKEKRILDTKQDALKIVANSFYGQTGYLRAKLYVLDIANAVTGSGRELIQTTKENVESDPRFKVIYGDTDSIMVKPFTDNIEETFNIGSEIEKKINEKFKGMFQIKLENVFKTILILTKKRYVGLSVEKSNDGWKENIMMKGIETVRRDWCDLASETLLNVLEIILKEQTPKKAFAYVKDVLQKLEKNQIPIEKLVVTKSISKPVKEYKGVQPHVELLKKLRKRSPTSAPGMGDRIGYVIVKGSQLMSERAEDPDYIKEHGLKIDSRYYIENQVLPPLERVFEAMNISKSELVGMGKQLVLSEAIREAKKPEKIVLNSIEGFVCNKCNKPFRRVPLVGKCNCGGEILFCSNGLRSRNVTL